MRKATALLLALSLAALTACSKAPVDSISTTPEPADSAVASSEPEPLPEGTSSPTEAPAESTPPDSTADTTDAQLAVLNGFVDFAADTAGGSLKTARAAADLVEYLSSADIDETTATDWMAGLTQDQLALLELNWSDILYKAQNIVSDPAGQADLLASAGVSADFETMELSAVPDKLAALDMVLSGQGT